jgi:DNA polymerase-3 subunit delta'
MVREAFAGIVGQETAIALLSAAIAQQRIAPAYLFAGVAGVGRRLTALCFAESLLGKHRDHATLGARSLTLQRKRLTERNHPDFLWIEPTYLHQGKLLTTIEAATAGIQRRSTPLVRLEQVREVSRFLARPPLEADRAVVLLEGAETMPEAAANGLLKTLEEPGQATLILLATETTKLLPTIISRCQVIPFRRLTAEEVAQIVAQTDYSALLKQPDILAMAQGSPGQAIAAWQQLQTISPEILTTLADPLPHLRPALDLARRISKELELEAQLWLIEYLQQRYWQSQRSPHLLKILETTRQHLRRFVQPRLAWEVTLMNLVEPATTSMNDVAPGVTSNYIH